MGRGGELDSSHLIAKLIEHIPKAELHMHVEGSFAPKQMLAIAERNDLMGSLPFKDLHAAQEAYQFKNLQEFLDIYYLGCNVLVKEKDFYDLTWAFLERAAQDKVAYVEIMFDPQTHTERGVPFETVISGISKALADADSKLGIQGALMMNFLRHLGPEPALKTLQEALPFKHLITAVGLDSTELGWPPSMWEEAYKQAASHGFRLSAHAGEEGGPEYIWEAINSLKVERIDHGVHCIEDPKLVAHLKQHRIPLTVCPLSNKKLKIYDGELSEKLKVLLDQGLLITLNADDPEYFGGYENAQYTWMVENLNLGAADIYKYAGNGFRAAFITEELRAKYLQWVDDAFVQVMGADALEKVKASL